MNNLPQVCNEEFGLWLKQFISKNLTVEADIIFIDLFQDGSQFSRYHTLSERVMNYIATSPKKKKVVIATIDSLLDFLVEKNVFDEAECQKERKNILKKLGMKTYTSR